MRNRPAVLMNPAMLTRIVLLSICLAAAITVEAQQLKSSQAKNLIRTVAGSAFPSSAVQVKKVSDGAGGTAEATAQIETAFRFQQDEAGGWEIREVRIAPDLWEDMTAIAVGIQTSAGAPAARECGEAKQNPAFSLNPKLARCLLAKYLMVELPSDAVRVREIVPLSLPLASRTSVTVLAIIHLDFRFQRESKRGWRITDFRTQNHEWTNLERVIAKVNESKIANAKAELAAVADALLAFRNKRGFFVPANEQRILIDHLTPDFLREVIRIDPWHRPYEYKGERDRFTLRSNGPDAKPDTPDDIVVTRP